jgi:SAM-dependent methyltransferase
MTTETVVPMHDLQEAVHGDGFDYLSGSPHLRHAYLNKWMRDTLNAVVTELADRLGRPPRVIEVGAGHGGFTETMVSAGAEVVVTEMSGPSARSIAARFRHNPQVTVHHDLDGRLDVHGEVDLVVYMAVLHHIPDYLASLEEAVRIVAPGGAIVSFQDPLYYPRQSRTSVALSRAATLAWRVTEGELARGFRTLGRRLRGVYDESSPSDMSEYHVVRDGVDEDAIALLLGRAFADVDVHRYFSTQGGWVQTVGQRVLRPNTFGVVATGRR